MSCHLFTASTPLGLVTPPAVLLSYFQGTIVSEAFVTQPPLPFLQVWNILVATRAGEGDIFGLAKPLL